MLIICTICSDIVTNSDNIWSTKCGHLFHHQCLQTWIERSKTCPQCRNKVTEKCMFRVYITIANEPSEENSAHLQIRLDNAMLQIREQTNALTAKQDIITNLKSELQGNQEFIRTLEKELMHNSTTISAYREQVDFMKNENKDMANLKEENEVLKNSLQVLQGLQKVFNSTVEEVEQMLNGYKDVRTVATFATALKKALCDSEVKKREMREKLNNLKYELTKEKKRTEDLLAENKQLEENYATMSKDYEDLKNNMTESVNVSDYPETDQNWPTFPEPNRAVSPFQVYEDDFDRDLNSMIKKIENSDSPYLNLKQSSLALAALQNPSMNTGPQIKPSEVGMFQSVKYPSPRATSTITSAQAEMSIFNMRDPALIESNNSNNNNRSDRPDRSLGFDFNVSYDGFGGHSRVDPYPVSSFWKPKTSVPKLTAKHKLKRPSPTGYQDIGEMMKKPRSE